MFLRVKHHLLTISSNIIHTTLVSPQPRYRPYSSVTSTFNEISSTMVTPSSLLWGSLTKVVVRRTGPERSHGLVPIVIDSRFCTFSNLTESDSSSTCPQWLYLSTSLRRVPLPTRHTFTLQNWGDPFTNSKTNSTLFTSYTFPSTFYLALSSRLWSVTPQTPRHTVLFLSLEIGLSVPLSEWL